MAERDATHFWTRYGRLAKKDLPIFGRNRHITTHPLLMAFQKPLSPADEAVAIAAALNTTVEFLVKGKDTAKATCSPAPMNIVTTADTLNDEGLKILAAVAESLSLKYHTPRRKS